MIRSLLIWNFCGNKSRSIRRISVCAKSIQKNQKGKSTLGTVDKFQGQQAPVVIYSLTTSSAEDAPRGMEFLVTDRLSSQLSAMLARPIASLAFSRWLEGYQVFAFPWTGANRLPTFGHGFDSHRPLQKCCVRSEDILYRTFRRHTLHSWAKRVV